MMAMTSIRDRFRSLDRHQGGAVILLVFAAFLILTLASMIVFEAGESAQAKMEIQTAADSSAYSQSVVKARSMNMISYSNTVKRMYYAYHHTYFAAALGLIASTAQYWSSCSIFNPVPCVYGAVGTAQIAAEGVNLATGVLSTISNSRDEVGHLDNYQEYLIGISPWWGFAEGLFRATTNGAHVSASWPPPAGTVGDGMNAIQGAIGAVNNIPGIDIPDVSTGQFDSLPVQKSTDSSSTAIAHTEYCGEYIMSPEQILASIDHYQGSASFPSGISREGQTLGLTALAFIPACVMAGFVFGNDVLDYRVDEGLFSGDLGDNTWMQRTSATTFAYQYTGHSERRANFYEHMLRDHDEGMIAYESEGNWAMSRSEIFYGPSPAAEALQSIPGFSGAGGLESIGNVASDALAGPVVALGSAGRPHMWTPRWTARLRPMQLPDETPNADLGSMYVDTVPYLGLGALAQSISPDFNLTRAGRDLLFMYAATESFDNDDMEGLYR